MAGNFCFKNEKVWNVWEKRLLIYFHNMWENDQIALCLSGDVPNSLLEVNTSSLFHLVLNASWMILSDQNKRWLNMRAVNAWIIWTCGHFANSVIRRNKIKKNQEHQVARWVAQTCVMTWWCRLSVTPLLSKRTRLVQQCSQISSWNNSTVSENFLQWYCQYVYFLSDRDIG